MMRPSDRFWEEIDDGPNRRVEAVRTIRELAANAGVPLLEPVADLVDEEHYADLAHLNRAGMQRFSEALGSALAAAVDSGSFSLPSGRSPRAR
jgi:lysophospholipase L1-like esterase